MTFTTTILIVCVGLAGLALVAVLWLIYARGRKTDAERRGAPGASVGVTNTAGGWETITSLPYPSASSSPNNPRKFEPGVACERPGLEFGVELRAPM